MSKLATGCISTKAVRHASAANIRSRSSASLWPLRSCRAAISVGYCCTTNPTMMSGFLGSARQRMPLPWSVYIPYNVVFVMGKLQMAYSAWHNHPCNVTKLATARCTPAFAVADFACFRSQMDCRSQRAMLSSPSRQQLITSMIR